MPIWCLSMVSHSHTAKHLKKQFASICCRSEMRCVTNRDPELGPCMNKKYYLLSLLTIHMTSSSDKKCKIPLVTDFL